MVPFKTINCPRQTMDAKLLAIRDMQETYQELEEEIIQNKAIVVIDFKNRYDLTWTCELQNAPQYLVDKFKNHDLGNKSRILSVSPEF